MLPSGRGTWSASTWRAPFPVVERRRLPSGVRTTMSPAAEVAGERIGDRHRKCGGGPLRRPHCRLGQDRGAHVAAISERRDDETGGRRDAEVRLRLRRQAGGQHEQRDEEGKHRFSIVPPFRRRPAYTRRWHLLHRPAFRRAVRAADDQLRSPAHWAARGRAPHGIDQYRSRGGRRTGGRRSSQTRATCCGT